MNTHSASRPLGLLGNFAQKLWQPRWLSVLSCGSVCRSCVTVPTRLASTHTALVSQSLVGPCVSPSFLYIIRPAAPSRGSASARRGAPKLKGTFMNGSGHWSWFLPVLAAVRQHCRAAVKLYAVRESVRGAA